MLSDNRKQGVVRPILSYSDFNAIDPAIHEVQAVITTPSRELAYQIYGAAKQLAKHSETEILVQNYVGGTDKLRQIEKIKAPSTTDRDRDSRADLGSDAFKCFGCA